MKIVYVLIVFISAVGLAYMAGRGSGFRDGVVQGSQQVAKPSNPSGEQISPEDLRNWKELRDRLAGITPDQIREYLRTQNADEKLKKADEILGKIIQGLVANIGLRLSQEEVAQMNGNPAVDTRQLSPAPTPEPIVEEKKNDKQSDRLYQKLKRQIQIASTEEQAQKILSELPADYERVRSAGVLNRQQIGQLNGHFEGTLTYLKDNTQVRTTLDFSGRLRQEDNRVMGNAQIVVYDKNGKDKSTGTSRGDLNQRYTGTPVSIFIESGGDYFELVYFPNMRAWIGNFMESSKGQLTKAGNLIYTRQ